MSPAAARKEDTIAATDTHIVVTADGPIPIQISFTGVIETNTSNSVYIEGYAAATTGSTAVNTPPHIPPAGSTFQRPPHNQGKIEQGSPSVFIGGSPAARSGDPVSTCNDPFDLPAGTVASGSTTVMMNENR
jgi:uncharacterized Zn-binding protein involved in type VI secretion